MDMTWTVEVGANGATHVTVHGDVDMSVERELHEALTTCIDAEIVRGGVVHVDLSGVRFMDSAGLRSLMRLHVDHGDTVSITEASAPVARLFELAGVAEWLLAHRRSEGAETA